MKENQNAIASSMADLNRLKKMNDAIINDCQFEINEGLNKTLNDKKITQGEYNEMLQQNKSELLLRNQGNEIIKQLEKRMISLTSSRYALKIAHPTELELKKLTTLINIKISFADTPNEKLFLNVLLQTTSSCLNLLKENKTIESKIIPLLTAEKDYVSGMLQQLNNLDLTESIQRKIAHKIQQTSKLKDTHQQIKTSSALSTYEKKKLNHFCNESINKIKQDIDLLLTPNHLTYDDKHLQLQIKDILITSEKIQSTNLFKKFINAICHIFQLKPLFATNNEMIEKMQQIKNELFISKDSLIESTNKPSAP